MLSLNNHGNQIETLNSLIPNLEEDQYTMTVIDEKLIRQGVRGLIVTPQKEVLLIKFKFRDMGERWAIPGGGKEADESDQQALMRELHEEVGLDKFESGDLIWERLRLGKMMKGKYAGQRDKIYLVRVSERFEPKPAMTWHQLNAENIYEIRWWSIEELQRPETARFLPDNLPMHILNLLEHGPPADGPIQIGS
jgi:8-oxo-dGTP pyrophosphatase MutT (NUDIX family)